MTRRVLTLLLGAMIACGLVAQEPGADKDKASDPPRLKKKKRDGVAPPEAKKDDEKPADPPKEGKGKEPVDPAKEGKGKEPAVKEGKGKEPPVKEGKGKEPPAKDDPIVPEDGERGDPQEDDKDIIERIAKNISGVEDKLANKELGEPTEQQQRDILKDIDALIRRNEGGGGGGGGEGGGGGGGEDDKDNKDDKGGMGGGMGQDKQGGGGKSRAQQRKEGREQAKNGGGKQRREIKSKGSGGGTKMAGGKEPRPEPKNQMKPGEGGNEPGAGKGGPQSDKMNPADLAKEVWGHLPESLRAEMNAYSNPQPFMPRYDDLIKKYYKAIAEKGRKKGD